VAQNVTRRACVTVKVQKGFVDINEASLPVNDAQADAGVINGIPKVLFRLHQPLAALAGVIDHPDDAKADAGYEDEFERIYRGAGGSDGGNGVAGRGDPTEDVNGDARPQAQAPGGEAQKKQDEEHSPDQPGRPFSRQKSC
jgi:hypothetical protein